MADEPECCTICAEAAEGSEVTRLECGHVFHVACALQWFRYQNTTCPNCRSDDTEHVWSRVHDTERLRAMRRRRDRLPRALRASLDRLDSYRDRCAELRAEHRKLHADFKEVFARDRRLAARLQSTCVKQERLRRHVARARADGVPHMRYHGVDGVDVFVARVRPEDESDESAA